MNEPIKLQIYRSVSNIPYFQSYFHKKMIASAHCGGDPGFPGILAFSGAFSQVFLKGGQRLVIKAKGM